MILITCSSNITGYKITRSMGLVFGNTIRARHIGNDIIAGLKNIIGGEINEYTKLMAEAREQAIDRMKESARHLGANAVIDVHFSTSMIMNGAAELLSYGTAVCVEKEKAE